jgi:hypothetical protein
MCGLHGSPSPEDRARGRYIVARWQRNQSKFRVDNANDIRLLGKMETDNKPMGWSHFGSHKSFWRDG